MVDEFLVSLLVAFNFLLSNCTVIGWEKKRKWECFCAGAGGCHPEHACSSLQPSGYLITAHEVQQPRTLTGCYYTLHLNSVTLKNEYKITHLVSVCRSLQNATSCIGNAGMSLPSPVMLCVSEPGLFEICHCLRGRGEQMKWGCSQVSALQGLALGHIHVSIWADMQWTGENLLFLP